MPAVLEICKFDVVVELVATNATEGLEPSIKAARDFLTHDEASGGRCKVLQDKARAEPD
jgi:hypothetical protein